VQESALRLNAGRAASIKFVELDGQPFLILSSLTRGAVLMKWEFKRVSGLASVAAIATGPFFLYK